MTQIHAAAAQLETLEPRRMLTTAPVLAVASTLTYPELHTPMPIDAAITVTFAGHISSATVKIATTAATPAYLKEDVLGFTANAATMGNITGAFNATTGVLTLSSLNSTATAANLQAALRAVTYSNTSHNPSVTNRSVTFTATAGTVSSTGLVSTVKITPVDDAPVLATASTLAYTKGQVATPINKVLTVTDVDNTTLASATFKMTNYVAGQDVLAYAPVAGTTGNIVATSAVSGTVMTWTFTSAGHTATLAQFQAALRAVTYKNTSATPTTTARTVTYAVNDGTLSSNVLTSQVTISYLNGASSLAYKVNAVTGTAAVINSTLTLGASAGTKIYSATVKMTNYVAGQDVLAYAPVAGTTGNIVATSAVSGTVMTWTLTSSGGTATLAQFQAALRAVTYKNISSTPTTTARTVNYQFFQGASSTIPSNVLTTSITLTNTSFDGAYTGHFYAADGTSVPTFMYYGTSYPLTSDQSRISSTITNGVGSVMFPGISTTTHVTSTLASNGTTSFAYSGPVTVTYMGFPVTVNVTITFTGKLTLNSNHTVTGTGTWSLTGEGGLITGSGKWTVTRPAP